MWVELLAATEGIKAVSELDPYHSGGEYEFLGVRRSPELGWYSVVFDPYATDFVYFAYVATAKYGLGCVDLLEYKRLCSSLDEYANLWSWDG